MVLNVEYIKYVRLDYCQWVEPEQSQRDYDCGDETMHFWFMYSPVRGC